MPVYITFSDLDISVTLSGELMADLSDPQVAREAEMAVHHDLLYRQLRVITPVPTDSVHSTAIAAVEAANHSKAAAIIVVTSTGQ